MRCSRDERGLVGWCQVELVGHGSKWTGSGWWGVGMGQVDGVAGIGKDG
jgi:hypothetical protein